MTNSRTLLIPFGILIVVNTYGQFGFEQYSYVNNSEAISIVPMATFESTRNWYMEARFNYEEKNSFSLYFGKTFTYQKKMFISVTPIAGAVVGQYKGGSVGVNVDIDYRKLFYSMQSQYTFSINRANEDFLFAWSEIAYQPFKWCYFGLSTQQTYLIQSATSLFEPGLLIGFIIGSWTFPIYSFSPGSSSGYFVVGANLKLNRLENKE